MLSAEHRAPVIIVEHVGGERSLDLISILVSHNLLLCLFLLLLFACTFSWAAGCAGGGSGDPLLLLLGSLFLVSGPVLGCSTL